MSAHRAAGGAHPLPTWPAAALTAAAAAVIVVLTTAAFWLSYAHLHTVAADHGLGASQARAWAWPATLDLFIVAGELLMLRASLARVTDWWAVALTVVGSGGSIALNVLGVEGSDPLAYVTAAVPPTAALLAFGALMRQVHTALAGVRTEVTTPVEEVTAAQFDRPVRGSTPLPEPSFNRCVDTITAPPRTPVPTEAQEVPTPARSNDPELLPDPAPEPVEDALSAPVATPVPTVEEVSPTEVPTAEPDEGDREEPALVRLSESEAAAVIEQCWREGVSQREAARRATRAPSLVGRVYKRLTEQALGLREAEPVAV